MSRSHADQERLRLPRWVRVWVYAGGALCAASGTVWLLLHHFAQREGDFGPEPHVLEHPALVLHGLSGLAMLWTLGLLWLPHVRRGWAKPAHRLVGGTMAVLMLALGVTAGGLYYLGNDALREATAIGHWIAGLAAAAWLPLHIALGRRTQRRRSGAGGRSPGARGGPRD